MAVSNRPYGWFGGKSMRLNRWFLAIAILGLGVLTACNSAELKSANTSPTAPAATTASPPADGVRRVTTAELKDMLDKNGAVVIDVRNEASYNTAHIRGAKLIPEAEILKHIDELPKNKLIVTYCS
jgi:3-mercaptopyruvate sulfurtransferase SseA